jgi:uncharacterized protein YndB with AHSA1/START domain
MKKVENTIAIQATAEKVWDALINPEKTKKYMFGCSPITDWKVGSSLLWRGVHEGNEMDFVTGFIKKIEPHKQLIYTVIDPFAAYPPLKRNHLNVLRHLKLFNRALKKRMMAKNVIKKCRTMAWVGYRFWRL